MNQLQQEIENMKESIQHKPVDQKNQQIKLKLKK
jgi:hypothetical protein